MHIRGIFLTRLSYQIGRALTGLSQKSENIQPGISGPSNDSSNRLTSMTPEGRSATSWVQGLGFSLSFFDRNCCTISCSVSFTKINVLSRLGRYTLERAQSVNVFFEFYVFF